MLDDGNSRLLSVGLPLLGGQLRAFARIQRPNPVSSAVLDRILVAKARPELVPVSQGMGSLLVIGSRLPQVAQSMKLFP
jgi:hypothetical protein